MSVKRGGNEQVLIQEETETCMYTYSAVGGMKKEEKVKGWELSPFLQTVD